MFGISEEGARAFGVDAKASLGETFSKSATVATNGDIITVTDVNGFEMKFQAKPGAAETQFTDASVDGTQADVIDGTDQEVCVTVLEAGPMDLQLGANEGQTMTVRIPRIDSVTLGTNQVNVCAQEGAQNAI